MLWDNISISRCDLTQMLTALNCIRVTEGDLFHKVILKTINFNEGNYREHAQCNIIVQDL